jgi:hypothetical protein
VGNGIAPHCARAAEDIVMKNNVDNRTIDRDRVLYYKNQENGNDEQSKTQRHKKRKRTNGSARHKK